ncbi:MAG: hypothetical protein P9M03_06005, partial [Candidatus Theseobacter exili]|nr:hypothetical protein [Candidatus Theseobacter exili]
MFYKLIIAGSFLLVFSGLVFCQPDYGKMDANGDGKIVKVEYIDGMKRTTFEKLDKNSDKEITWDEWTQMDNSPDAQKNFQSMDLDNDQKVTYSEFSNSMDR